MFLVMMKASWAGMKVMGLAGSKAVLLTLAGVVEAMPRLTKHSCLWLIHIWTAAIHKWDRCVHPLGTNVTVVMVWSVYN